MSIKNPEKRKNHFLKESGYCIHYSFSYITLTKFIYATSLRWYQSDQVLRVLKLHFNLSLLKAPLVDLCNYAVIVMLSSYQKMST